MGKEQKDNLKQRSSEGFVPMSREELLRKGIETPDFVYVIGDAYVDHSSFGPAIIARVLESKGYSVGIIAQPDWTDPASVTVFGTPRLGFLVSAGNMDSMVNHYTVNKKHRHEDAYTPSGVAGKRPDRATLVYCNLIKKNYKNSPILIGGIEASLRRLGHYDYWSDKMKRSLLLDSGADILMYGMGEKAVVEIADALASGIPVSEIMYVRGTCWKTAHLDRITEPYISLPDFSEIESVTAARRADGVITDADKAYARSFKLQYENTDPFTAKVLAESYGENRFVVQNPPQMPLTTEEMDAVYELPYMNSWHPIYDKQGGVPALSEIKFSLTSCRGCFGACSFCALTFHQGRIVQARSRKSLVNEAKRMTADPDFKGYIHDVGGPTGNFRKPACEKQMKAGTCKDRQCLFPDVCKNCKADHSDYIALLRELRELPGVKKVFVRSGIRFDYALADASDAFLKELCRHHVSGQLRVAPEHVTDHVLNLMGKPKKAVFDRFRARFEELNAREGLNQYMVSYLISSHPGSTVKDAIALAESVRDMGYMPEQVQDFYPTPSTVSTVMFATGLDPRTMQPVYIPVSYHEKAMQRALIQYRDPKNYRLVKEALLSEGREDLIGFDRKHCLIPPREPKGDMSEGKKPGEAQNRSGKTGSASQKHDVKTGNASQKHSGKTGSAPQKHSGKPGNASQKHNGKTTTKKRG